MSWRTPDASATVFSGARVESSGRQPSVAGWGFSSERKKRRERGLRTSDGPPAEVDDEARLELGDALPEEVQARIEVALGVVPPVHGARRKVGAVAVRGVGHGAERAEVVDPVQRRLRRRRVVPAEEEVDRVGLARPERRGELGADPRGGRGRAQRDVVAVGLQEPGAGRRQLLVLTLEPAGRGEGVRGRGTDRIWYRRRLRSTYSENWSVSPGSPESARMQALERQRGPQRGGMTRLSR